jgi:hypothetical protein
MAKHCHPARANEGVRFESLQIVKTQVEAAFKKIKIMLMHSMWYIKLNII